MNAQIDKERKALEKEKKEKEKREAKEAKDMQKKKKVHCVFVIFSESRVTKEGEKQKADKDEFAQFLSNYKSRKAGREVIVVDAGDGDFHLTKQRWKFLSYAEDYRPPYFGTWSKSSAVLSGRQPFKCDVSALNYEADSEAEWEEEEPGEELGSEDEEDDEDDGEDEVADEVQDDGFICDTIELDDSETFNDASSDKRTKKKVRLIPFGYIAEEETANEYLLSFGAEWLCGALS
ncbi:hypothetical protein HK101_002386 [Irineochytrium annulatum]|nr:hypothetical protein HK101_002386 [Irineochytrium annulatum]